MRDDKEGDIGDVEGDEECHVGDEGDKEGDEECHVAYVT